MRRSTTQQAVTLAGVLALVATTVLPLQPVFGEGGARRDVVRQEEQNLKDAIEHAKVAVFHGKDGDAEALLEHAEDALQHALKGGTDNPHRDTRAKFINSAGGTGKASMIDGPRPVRKTLHFANER